VEETFGVRFVLQPSDLDVFVSDESGRDVCWVQGPTGRVGRWSLRSLAGDELATIRQHGSPFLPRFSIQAPDRSSAELRELPVGRGPRVLAALRIALAGAPARVRYALEVAGEEPLRVDGDASALEYAFVRGGRPAATVSAYWLAAAATWGATVTVADDLDPLVVLAATATIEIAWGRSGRRHALQPAIPSPVRP
jgi:uncharacterized protein YxjI